MFIGEGPSDAPLADIVRRLFLRESLSIEVSAPDFARLPATVTRDVSSKVGAALKLTSMPIDVFIIHRDADTMGASPRIAEIAHAIAHVAPNHVHVPVVPICTTEAWLLLDESAIRVAAGKPKGRTPLALPSVSEVERRADPKAILATALLAAAEETGRRRQRVARRFNEHRRRLLDQLDIDGPVTTLPAWQALVVAVADAAEKLRSQ